MYVILYHIHMYIYIGMCMYMCIFMYNLCSVFV